MPSLRGGRRHLLVAASTMFVTGAVCLGIGVAAQRSAPQPPPAIAHAPVEIPAPSASPGNHEPPSTASAPPAASASAPATNTAPAPLPVSVEIPAIGVHAPVIPLGLQPDGEIQVPADVQHVGWYRLGPAPGQIGPAVLLGHVDSAHSGPGVFFRLGALRNGDVITVARTDGSAVSFIVYAVREYQKDFFPTALVYGPTPDPEIRLITCGGAFDRHTGHYLSNIVVFARLAG